MGLSGKATGLEQITVTEKSNPYDSISAIQKTASILLDDYCSRIENTDKLSLEECEPVLFGLFGEVGGVMSTAKKRRREGDAYDGHREEVVEEFGDTLWYFAALCRRWNYSLPDIFDAAISAGEFSSSIAASDIPDKPVSQVFQANNEANLDQSLIELGKVINGLLDANDNKSERRTRLTLFAVKFLETLQAAKISFADVARENIEKVTGRFLQPDMSRLPVFDDQYPAEEKLPDSFEIKISQNSHGHSRLSWNNVFIGDTLTDNSLDCDGYRFHDVFHFSNAAILNWSPTFRSLIKKKRKSNSIVDETQDGGRAIVIEEGLTAWIFSRAKRLDLFRNQKHVSLDILKTISQFVRGYEVEECPLSLWEKSILDGYAVFRQVLENQGGVVIGNRQERSITYKL